MRRRHVVAHNLLQSRELPGVHVRRACSHTAQARRLKGDFERRIIGDLESQLLALLGPGVAERPEVSEVSVSLTSGDT